ncbi:MAG: histidine phosphatase family protein [Acidobacteria bacterium]|nr:histidine phosphatase family protein [Acidobacteriota bacterium]
MHVFLVHHGDAVGPDVDPRHPLSPSGRAAVERLATEAAGRGARPAVVWHSGKLRAKQTAETFWRACNALAELSATKDLQPDDPPQRMRGRLIRETRDVLIAGHYPHLPNLFALLVRGGAIAFPQHGVVALVTEDGGETWREMWRLEV